VVSSVLPELLPHKSELQLTFAQLRFQKHGKACGATFDPVYNWQAGPEMVKLSLLVLLDGKAMIWMSGSWRCWGRLGSM